MPLKVPRLSLKLSPPKIKKLCQCLKAIYPKQPDLDFSKNGGVLQAGRRVFLPADAVAGTDGSEHSRDPRMRRVGLGLVLATARGCKHFGAACGILEGQRQSVSRAELNALLELVRRTDGDVTCIVDCEYVVKGFRKGPRAVHRSHGDLRSQLWRAMQSRAGCLRVRQVHSHATAK